MEYLALYRKYRPKELEEVVGQCEVKQILASSVDSGKITHAYLFSGPRGTGKTTMAKILAKMVNCESPINGNPCNKCKSCLNILDSNDVIEIDAASNNGVDEIRDLREKANLVPSSAKYKVYIIDEVHMLTTQAFNALLKTLEEPPKHVIFILATTEYYKIPLTITSRCQKFQFNKISIDDIVKQLKKISVLENIVINDEALYEIAKISDGGMRDSINFLDQLRSLNSGSITIDDVYNVCGNVSSEKIVSLFVDISNNNVENVTDFFEHMDINGKNYGKFFEDVIAFLRDVILFKKNVNDKYIVNNIGNVDEISKLFDFDTVFYMIEEINNLMGKLNYVSRQSVIVVANFLMIMNNVNKKDDVVVNLDDKSVENTSRIDLTLNVNDGDGKLDDNDVKLVAENEIKKSNYMLENKEIIINNAFALANKEVKNKLQENFNLINDYLTDKKFKLVAGTLIDTVVEVAANEYLILSTKSDFIVDRVYENYKLCSELIKNIFGNEYYFAVINTFDWGNYRDEYIKNIRNGKKYEFIELKSESTYEKDNLKVQTVVDKLFDLVGEDNIEFK